MAEIDEKKLKEEKKQLEGVLILCWVMAIITGLAIFSGFSWGWGPIGFITHYLDEPFTMFAATDIIRNVASFPFRMVYSLIVPALYVAELIGIYQRKSFAIPLGRAVLVVTMVFFFPVGTIIGAILWKRFNHPLSKEYLNYES
jgi:hypothetical protein